ncbi:MAG: hypothetical protein AAB463_00475 [Patescibacteria group bacterium]
MLTSKNLVTLKRVVAGLTTVATALSFTGMALVLSSGVALAAARPADYGLREGNTISAAGSSDPDVYIVNDLGYKRLFLNPAIFNMYGHLGGFANVKTVTPATRDAFGTSGLFRNCETGDQKVYGLDVTGEDTAILRWVNTTGAQAVADDSNFFAKVFCINTNEFNSYNKGSDFTSVLQVPVYVRGGVASPSSTPVSGSVNFSLASNNPASATLTTNAQGVEFLRFKVMGTGTLSEVTFKRLGAGSTNDFDNLYVYDGARRLTSGKSLSSSTGEVTFANLNLSVSGTKELSLVGDLSATAGNVNYFELKGAMLASGSVGGLPVTGNTMSVSGATSGGITMNKVGSIPNPTVGQKGAQISEFKLTANTEAASVKRITVFQGGTVKPSDITNIKLKAGTNEWAGSMTSDSYLVFDLGSGFSIVKGGEQVFKVYADLGGKKDEDINLYFENSTDILAIGDQYGFGMAATITDMDTAAESFDVTLQGGVLTISSGTLGSANIGTDTSDTTLLEYSVVAASNIEVRKTEFTLCHDPAGNGSYANAADATNGWADLDDFKVTNKDTGVTIMGPQDGSAFTTSDAGTCEDAATGAQKSFTDTYDLVAGKTYNFKVTADIKTANSRSGTALAAADAIQVFLDNFTDDTPDITVMKYAGTNTAVADADIVPQSDMAGPALTIQASSLSLGLSSSVNDQSFVRGTKNVDAVGITFKAAQASDLKVTDITLTGYISDLGSTFSVGSDTEITVADRVSAVKIYEAESGTLLSGAPSSNQLSNTTGTVTFNNLNWNIPAGATKTLLVRVDLGSNPTSASGSDYFAFDINATSDVTALDSSSRTVNAGTADPNGATTPSTVVTVMNSGSLAVALNTADSPQKHSVYWGQTGDVAGVWRFTATNEAQYLEKVQFGEDDIGGTQETDFATNSKLVHIQYKNKAGTMLTKSGTVSSAGTVSFGFSGEDRPYVPKDSSLDMKVMVDYKTKAEGATSGKVWDLAFIGDSGTGTDTFKAVGEGSGVVLQGDSTGIADSDLADASRNTRIYRVFPEFALVAPTATKLSTVDPVLTFTITAKGLSDSRLFFDNTAVASGSIKFDTVASGVGLTADPAFTVRDEVGTIVDSSTITNATNPSVGASLTIDFTSLDIEVTGGTSKTLKVYLDSITDFNTPTNTSSGVASDYFQIVLRDNENSLIQWVDNSTNASSDADVASTQGFLRNLPMSGYQFTAQ